MLQDSAIAEVEFDDQFEVTALSDLDFEADEVTEMIEFDPSRTGEVHSGAPRVSFMSSLFRAL